MTAPRSGSSFALAARLLPAQVRRDALALYSFCRRVDDLADLTADRDEARRALAAVRSSLVDGTHSEREILELIDRRGVPLEPLLDLIDAVTSDLGPVRIPTRRALDDYCYGVAGTVGVAMAAVLGVERSWALGPAVDLGIAMQLTNIARDVVEDAARDRIYLPLDTLGPEATPERLVIGEPVARRVAWSATRELLAEARQLYRRADCGMAAIPLRSRPAIVLASRGYEEIGRDLLRHGPDAVWRRPVAPRRRTIVGRGVVGLLASLGRPSRVLSDGSVSSRRGDFARASLGGS